MNNFLLYCGTTGNTSVELAVFSLKHFRATQYDRSFSVSSLCWLSHLASCAFFSSSVSGLMASVDSEKLVCPVLDA